MSRPESPDRVAIGAPGVLSPSTPPPPAGELAQAEAAPPAGREEQPGKRENERPCPECGSSGKRSLVVCIDGTSNQFSTKNTNVVELYSRLTKDEHQLTFYNSGIGTYAKPSWKSWGYYKQVVANKLDLAFALRFEKIIISAYAWLVDNYQPGDQIFLFGFSRGAYQVRALAAMIDIVGLLHKGNDDQIPFAYELYAASGDAKKLPEAPQRVWKDVRPLRERISHAWKSRKEGGKRIPSFPWPVRPKTSDTRQAEDDATMQEQTKAARRTGANTPTQDPHTTHTRRTDVDVTLQTKFKETFSRPEVRVHFVGAWDTVSSVGFIREKTLPSTTDGMRFVCLFRHALALHEFRVKFLPEYVNGGAGPSYPSTVSGTTGQPHTKEVWFTGSHSDIGGGSTPNTSLDKFGPALRWMSWEATLAGLRLVDTPDSWEPIGVSKSMTNIWRIVECLPIKRLSYPSYKWHDAPTKQSFTLLPHFSERRHIQPLQRIHQSVYEECENFQQPSHVEQEADAYLILRPQEQVLRDGWIIDAQRRDSLQRLTSSQDGIQSLTSFNIFGYIYDIARKCRDKPEASRRILEDLRSLHVAYVQGAFKVLQEVDLPQDTDINLGASPETFAFAMCGHSKQVFSVAFSSNARVVSGSWDRTVRIWDVSTGEMTLDNPLSCHNGSIHCVAAHTAKGLVASASSDTTIRLWTSDSNGAVRAGKILQDGSISYVLAVAFSPDGSHLVSGSTDGPIRVWNTATGERVGEPVRGHTGLVWSVGFSSDGTRVVSGSADRTVRLWESTTGEATLRPCGEPLEGHTGEVNSVAFSPDAHVIASASHDKTVCLWDVDSRTLKSTLVGHTDWVWSVAFAPSGKHVVSGSADWTVRIWDACTGAAVRVLRGHTDIVKSVAFSPDGTRIASGSWDKTVRIWDFLPDHAESQHDDNETAAQVVST